MTYLKKVLFAASLAVASLGFTSFSANAVLITQEILVDGFTDPIAVVTAEFDDKDLGAGTGFVTSFDLIDIEILGLPSFLLDVIDFEVIVDGSNVLAGFEFLYVDANDLFVGDEWAYQIQVDAFSPDDNFIDIFTFPAGDLIFADFGSVISFGQATFVPEPSTIALFGLSLLALGARRRKA